MADGTVVPQAVVVAAGDDVRFCRISAPLGATVAELSAAAPCASGGPWQVRLDGRPGTLAQRVGLGEIVALEPAPAAEVVPPPPGDRTPIAAARDEEPAQLLARARGRRLGLTVTCPAASDGCRVTVLARSTFKARGERRAKPREVGRTTVTLAPGEGRSVTLRMSAKFRRELRDHSHRTVRLRAVTRTTTGTDLVDRVTVTLRR